MVGDSDSFFYETNPDPVQRGGIHPPSDPLQVRWRFYTELKKRKRGRGDGSGIGTDKRMNLKYHRRIKLEDRKRGLRGKK